MLVARRQPGGDELSGFALEQDHDFFGVLVALERDNRCLQRFDLVQCLLICPGLSSEPGEISRVRPSDSDEFVVCHNRFG